MVAFTRLPVSVLTGCANQPSWPTSTLNAAISVPLMDGVATAAAMVRCAAPPSQSRSGASCFPVVALSRWSSLTTTPND